MKQAEQLVEDLIAVLEGKKTRNEISDLRSIAIFKQGLSVRWTSFCMD